MLGTLIDDNITLSRVLESTLDSYDKMDSNL